jgi:outer membrane lipoprotein carrier protein
MRLATVLLGAALSCGTALAADPAPSPSPAPKAKAPARRAPLPHLLQQVEDQYGKAKTLSAKFNQLSRTSVTGTLKKSSGTVLFKRPNKFRWEVVKPDPSISVSNGIRAWHYTPPFDEGEQGQVLEQKASRVRTHLANALLSGSFSAARDMKISQAGPSSFTLLPKRGTAGTVKKALVEIDVESKQIRKVTLEHADGGRAEITLSEIELGKAVPDDTFDFKIPPNTDRAAGG